MTDAESIAGIDPYINPPDGTVAAPGIAAVVEPSMAADPRHENDVYVLFPARAPSSDVGFGNAGNVDLFIAHSSDGGATFPESQVLHLTDQNLGDAPGTHQIMAALTVDAFGGLNILYYAQVYAPGMDPPSWFYQAKYGHLAGFTTAPVQPAVASFPLGNQFAVNTDLTLYPPNIDQATGHGTIFLGEYVMGDSRGCDVYFGYPSGDPAGVISVYVSKIRISNACAIAADVNADGAVTVADATQFFGDFANGAPAADINHDSAVTLSDANLFIQSYSCGCNP